MVIDFANKKVEKICTNRKEAVKALGSKVDKALFVLMNNLCAAKHISDFYKNPIFKKYRAHELEGDKQGILSLSIDFSYRMTALVKVQIEEDYIIILEVSNHYGE